jgi:hypothetical protein
MHAWNFAAARPAFFVGVAVVGALGGLCGCQPTPGYPKVTPVAALDHPGTCAYCGRKIERVNRTNLLTVEGVEYVVCDQACREGQEKGVAEQ